MKYTLEQVVGEFEAAHMLTADKGKYRNLHGHHYKVILSVEGNQLDNQGFLIPFDRWIYLFKTIIEALDHSMITAYDTPMWLIQGLKEQKCKMFHLPAETSTTENIARYLLRDFIKNFKEEYGSHPNDGIFNWIEIKVYETPTFAATARIPGLDVKGK